MAKIVVYYSMSSNTKKAAEDVAAKIGADLFALEVVEPYPEDFNEVIKVVQDHKKEGKLPEIAQMPDLSGYDEVIIGSPNWFGTISPPAEAFIKAGDFAGKTVALLLTHGTGGLGKSESDLPAWAKGAAIKPALGIAGPGDEGTNDRIAAWIADNGL
ncbi:MAG: flavodoxin [Eubacteriaceae bacterium]|nr:flavodoxin [Eubacteriaceae bacterium]